MSHPGTPGILSLFSFDLSSLRNPPHGSELSPRDGTPGLLRCSGTIHSRPSTEMLKFRAELQTSSWFWLTLLFIPTPAKPGQGQGQE